MTDTKISNYELFLGANKLLKNIIWLNITMNYFLWVNMVNTNADHCENSENLFFWNKLFFIDNDIFDTLIALFNYNTRLIFILDKVYYSQNKRVIKCSQTANLTFGCSLIFTCVKLIVKLIIKLFDCINFLINFRLDFKDTCLSTLINQINWIIIVVFSDV